MELHMTTFLIVCPLVLLAGFVDAIGGGGGLISLPAYYLAGVPIHHAIATNKLSSATGTLISTIRIGKSVKIRWKLIAPAVVMALIGSYLGTRLSPVDCASSGSIFRTSEKFTDIRKNGAPGTEKGAADRLDQCIDHRYI